MLGFGIEHRREHKSDQTTTTAYGESVENMLIVSTVARCIYMERRAISGRVLAWLLEFGEPETPHAVWASMVSEKRALNEQISRLKFRSSCNAV